MQERNVILTASVPWHRLSGSTLQLSCHDGSMLSKGGAVEKPSLNASPTHTQPRFAGVLHESITT